MNREPFEEKVNSYRLGENEDAVQLMSRIISEFCETNRIMARGYDASGRQTIPFTGNETARDFLSRLIPAELENTLIASFRDGDVENILAGEANQPSVLVRAIAIRGAAGKLIGAWVLYAIASEIESESDLFPEELYRTTTEDFERAVRLLSILTDAYFKEKFHSFHLEDRLEETRETQERLHTMLRRNEVMTNILKLLESDSDFNKVAEDIIREASEYTGVTDGALIQKNPVDDTVDMLCEWKDGTRHSLMPQFLRLPVIQVPFFTGKPYTISSDSIMPDEFRRFFLAYDITAGIFLPLSVSDEVGMYLCFFELTTPRKWTVEDIRFLNDVKRVLQTILIKRVTKNSLASSYAVIDAILENAGCGICVNEVDQGIVLYSNETFTHMFSDMSDRTAFENLLLNVENNPESAQEFHAENADRWYSASFTEIYWVDGRKVRMCTLYDITNLKDYQKQIEDQINRDEMTGIYNRHRFRSDFEASIRDAVRSGGDQGTFLYVDLDDFKDINDGLGHHVGDALLKNVARSLESIVKDVGTCYRIGGDEFAVLIPFYKQKEAEAIEETIRKRFAAPWKLGEGDYYCTMCMGVVCYPKDGVSEETLMQRADYALYKAKQLGKNEIAKYDASEADVSAKRLDMERCMRDAVADGCREFEVYYQPLVDISRPDHPCCGAEALVRWNSKELGFIQPAEFIQLAEYLGLITPIGEHVLVEACKRCKFWNDFGHPEYKVNVNLSVVQLLQKNIVDTVKNAIVYTGINPGNLTLEVTESLAVNDMDAMTVILKNIRALGVRLALDDFGTGYSSLSYLREMPLDVIKIDKCFVDDVGEDVFSDAFVKTVSELAETINLNVIVEGIEEKRQEDALSGMKVDMIQGYLYDKPLSQEEFEAKYLS